MKGLNLPSKCYWAYWCLGWCIDEYDIDEITFDYNKETITKIKCHKPHEHREFDDEISNTVFFDLSEAQRAVEELVEKDLSEK